MGKCLKGKSEAKEKPGSFRCKKCGAVSGKKDHLCDPREAQERREGGEKEIGAVSRGRSRGRSRCRPRSRGSCTARRLQVADLLEEVALPAHAPVVGRGQRRQVAADGRGELGALEKSHRHPQVPGVGGAGGEDLCQPLRPAARFPAASRTWERSRAQHLGVGSPAGGLRRGCGARLRLPDGGEVALQQRVQLGSRQPEGRGQGVAIFCRGVEQAGEESALFRVDAGGGGALQQQAVDGVGGRNRGAVLFRRRGGEGALHGAGGAAGALQRRLQGFHRQLGAVAALGGQPAEGGVDRRRVDGGDSSARGRPSASSRRRRRRRRW